MDMTGLESRAGGGHEDERRSRYERRHQLTGATFLFVQAEEETEGAVRTWGGQARGAVGGAGRAGRAVEVVVVGRDPVRLAADSAAALEVRTLDARIELPSSTILNGASSAYGDSLPGRPHPRGGMLRVRRDPRSLTPDIPDTRPS